MRSNSFEASLRPTDQAPHWKAQHEPGRRALLTILALLGFIACKSRRCYSLRASVSRICGSAPLRLCLRRVPESSHVSRSVQLASATVLGFAEDALCDTRYASHPQVSRGEHRSPASRGLGERSGLRAYWRIRLDCRVEGLDEGRRPSRYRGAPTHIWLCGLVRMGCTPWTGAALYCCPRRAGIGIQPTMVHPILLKQWSSSSHRHHRRAFVVRTS